MRRLQANLNDQNRPKSAIQVRWRERPLWIAKRPSICRNQNRNSLNIGCPKNLVAGQGSFGYDRFGNRVT